ncbi:MAG: DUF885 domain-containing protein [Acidimicrobiales bacterium]|jgi:uncharacterized protein (DUF885 family)
MIPPRPDTPFDVVLDQWLAHEFAASPVTATALGAEGAHGEIDDLTAAAFAERAAADAAWLAHLLAVDAGRLGPDQRVDRDALIALLRGRQVLESWRAWRRNPSVYLDPCFDGILSLVIHRSFPEEELARYTTGRLRAMAGALEAGRANLSAELANPLIVGRAINQCEAAIPYFQEMLPREFTAPALRAAVAEAAGTAAESFQGFRSFLTELATSARGDYAIGEERYSALLRERELLGYGAVELRARGRRVLGQLESEMNELARGIDPHAPTWRSVFAAMSEDHPATFEEMRDCYENEVGKARAFLRANDLVSLPPGEECRVEPTPPFLRPIIAVASYISPPAFRPGRVGHFNVPWPPAGTTPADNARLLAANNRHVIPTITVHEAYPGHHWHLTWMKTSTRRVRQFVHSSYFSEGWALYAEQMMREQGYFSERRAELGQLNARIFRAARIVVDTGLHIGDLGVEEAVAYMETNAGLPAPVARAEVSRYCAWPTQAPSYLTGSLEIERIRQGYLAAGRGNLRSFHDAIAATGCLPLALVERALLAGS